jgi:shikimate dehydrogenase
MDVTDVYAIIGNPVSHTKSPFIHAEFARQTGEDMRYEAILAPLDGFAATVAQFRESGGKGLNITLPFKLEAFELATQLTERAEQARAVNTLRFDADTILGDNTDGAGVVRDIQNNLGFSIQGKRVLLMGAGGAAQGALLPVLEQQPELVVIANRTAEKAVALENQFSGYGKVSGGDYARLKGKAFDLVINSTSTGLTGELPPLPQGVFAPSSLAYDMVYGKGLTRFLEHARDNGAERLADGLGMLVEQAVESFYLWRGVRPDGRPVMEKLRAE